MRPSWTAPRARSWATPSTRRTAARSSAPWPARRWCSSARPKPAPSRRHLQMSYLPLRLADGTLDGFIGVAQDITEHKVEQARLLELTRLDPLTGALNRAGFEHALDEHVRRPRSGQLALLCIDLDHFKSVNDRHGHPVGDELLKLFVRRLRNAVRPTDAVARLGGDEFAVLLDGLREAANAEQVAEKVLAAAEAPFHIDALEVQVGASVGIAVRHGGRGGPGAGGARRRHALSGQAGRARPLPRRGRARAGGLKGGRPRVAPGIRPLAAHVSSAPMYAQYFGLKQEPFSIAPDPRYLFMSERHREALAHLLYGVGGGGGFVLLTGEIGAGKTTVCRCFLEQIPRRCNVAYIFNPKLTVTELLQDGVRRVPHPGRAPRAGHGHGQGLHRPAQRVPAQDARGGPEQRADHRRGAEPLGRRARAAAPADQPGNQRAQAAADHPDRPARAAQHARPARARAAGAARDRALPPRRAVRGRDRAVHPAPAGGGGHEPRDPVRRARAAPHPPALARRAAPHQPAVRPRAARRLRQRQDRCRRRPSSTRPPARCSTGRRRRASSSRAGAHSSAPRWPSGSAWPPARRCSAWPLLGMGSRPQGTRGGRRDGARRGAPRAAAAPARGGERAGTVRDCGARRGGGLGADGRRAPAQPPGRAGAHRGGRLARARAAVEGGCWRRRSRAARRSAAGLLPPQPRQQPGARSAPSAGPAS